jgi:hypothetical protein
MDLTLRDYLKSADDAHALVDKFGMALGMDMLKETVTTLQTNIKNIQAVARRMADVSNIINELILQRNAKTTTAKVMPYLDPYPTENDHAVLRIKYPDEVDSKEILPDIVIPIKYVEKATDVPVSNLYYVKELKQYAINIAGVTIKGDLANLVPYQERNSARCEYGIGCKSFAKGKVCNYYHEPEDYLKLKLPIPDDNVRNFTIGSFIYSNDKRLKTYYTRHLGSKDMIIHDLRLLKKIQYRDEVNNREGQLIHDLLIYMILHNRGFLEKYKHWTAKS